MKIILGIILFLLPTCGVFGAETNVQISVKEGQTVTLKTDINGIKEINRIMWRFETLRIAEFINNKTMYLNNPERFNRLKLNSQTGSLTIMDIKTTDTGLYKGEINHKSGTSKWLFNVTVIVPDSGLSPGAAAGISVVVLLLVFAGAAAFVFYHRHKFLPNKEAHEGEFSVQQCQMYDVKMVSVKEGKSVTLKPGAVIQREDQILWMFGPQETLINAVNTREISTGDGADGRFRDRLRLDSKTGSVTITNTASEHVGVYKLKIISSTVTSYQTFILTIIYKEEVMSVSAGSSVTLDSGTEIQKDDLIQWMFGDEHSLIAQLQKTTNTVAFPDERFKSLNLDMKTGSLTITNIKNNHSGLYKLQVSNSNRATTNKTFKVLVNFSKVSGTEGKPVKLKLNGNNGTKDPIQWLYGEEHTLIAEIKEGGREILTYDTADGRFKDRLMVNDKTGNLTIRNTRPDHAGLYTVKIKSSKEPLDKQYFVIVRASMILGKEGNDATLNVQDELQRDDLILWMFGDENNLIAQMNRETTETTFTEADKRFRDRLLMDTMTGSLTIRNITSEHSGAYKLHIVSSKKPTYSTFRVFVFGDSNPNTMSVMAGENLILITNFNVERDDQLQWKFEDDILVSGMNGDVSKTSYRHDKRFKCRLELHHQTASLTVKETRNSDSGVYQLNFWNRHKKNICLKVNVIVSDDSRNTPNEAVNIQMPQSENPE